jgi:hypothetical protein
MKNKSNDTLSYKDWSEAGDDLERIGKRLDVAREILEKSIPGTWADDYWKQVHDRLQRSWQQTISLMDIGLKQISPITANKIDRTWFENPTELGGVDFTVPVFRDMVDSHRIGVQLEKTWQNNLDEKIQKARQGLA